MKYGKSYTQTSFGQFLPSSPWDSWNSQQGKENVGIFFFFSCQLSTRAFCKPQPWQLSRILEEKRDFSPHESNIKYWVGFIVYFIDNFIYLLPQDLPKSLFPSGNSTESRGRRKGGFPSPQAPSQPVFCTRLQGIRKCAQGLRPLRATEELGAPGYRNQRFLSRNL